MISVLYVLVVRISRCSGHFVHALLLLPFSGRISVIEGRFVDVPLFYLFGVRIPAFEGLAFGSLTSCFDDIGVIEFLLVVFSPRLVAHLLHDFFLRFWFLWSKVPLVYHRFRPCNLSR